MWRLPVALLLCVMGGRGGSGLELRGAGSDLTQDLFMDLVFAYRFVNESVSLAVPLVDACRIMAPTECGADDTSEPMAVDFAISSTPLTEEQYEKYPDLQMYPILAVSVVPIYNLGNSSAQLQLTQSTLARIFTGEVRTWDDADIAATNPTLAEWGIPAGQPIEVVISSESLGTTVIFKKSLAAFYTTFGEMAGPSDSPFWGNVTVTDVKETDELQTYVLLHRYTIGFCILRDAVVSEFPIPQLIKAGGHVVTASITSLGYAVLELGLNFGNNGEPAERLTADLEGALGAHAWPIAGYTYLVMRKDTLRANATCDYVRQTVDFFYWYWTNAGTETMAERTYSTGLPTLVQQEVVARFVADIRCHGRPIYQVAKVASITGAGLGLLASAMQLLNIVYSAKDAGTVSYAAADDEDPLAALANYTFALSPTASPLLGPHSVGLPFLGMGYAVLSSYSVVLDGATLAAILQGSITTWLDPRITALNPGGLQDAEGQNLTDPTRSITLFQSTTVTSDPFLALMKTFRASYTGAAVMAATLYADPVTLQSAMQLQGSALSVVPLAVELNPAIFHASFQRADGDVVQPSATTVQTCAQSWAQVLDAVTNTVHLSTSPAQGCYPLATTVYLTIRRSSCDAATDPNGVATVAFFEWLLDSDGVAEAFLDSGFSPLQNSTPQATDPWRAYVSAALRSVSCTHTDDAGDNSPLVLAVVLGCCGAGLLAVAALLGGWLWRYTAPMRRMRKMMSNDNVAEECVEAISRFDLDAVAWLRELPKPNRIQRAFVRIVTLLEDLKPFIPDQLLATLAARDRGPEAAAQDSDTDAEVPQSITPKPEAVKCDHAARNEDGGMLSPVSSDASQTSPPVGRLNSGGSAEWRRRATVLRAPAPASSAPSDGPRSAHSGSAPATPCPADWVRRQCVYMYVQFGLDVHCAEEGVNLLWLAHVAGRIAGAGKARAGTLDRVTFSTVIVHWGATGTPAGAVLVPVTSLAMELAQADMGLPAELQPHFWLRIGIGAGMCTVATLTAGGLRFFVLGGKEVATTASLVTSAVAAKFKGCVLLTSAAHQEVHYQVRCCPRVWFGDTLLWEPLGLREKEVQIDEWMYQLQEMDNQGGSQDTGHEMHTLFLMPRNDARPEDVRRAVDEFRDRHAGRLSDKDVACLALLVASAATVTPSRTAHASVRPWP